MRISTKILSWQLVLMLFIVANGANAIYSSRTITTSVAQLKKEITETERALASLKNLIINLENTTKTYFLSQAAEAKDGIEAIHQELRSAGQAFSQKIRGHQGLHDQLQALLKEEAAYRESITKIDAVLMAVPDPTIRRTILTQSLAPLQAAEATMTNGLDAMSREIAKQSEANFARIEQSATNQRWLAWGIMLASLVAGKLLAFVSARLITRPLDKVIRTIGGIASRISEVAADISAGSQELSQVSARQSSSLEETSSVHEEISSMAHRNVEHAGEADQIMTTVQDVMARVNASMTQLTGSMGEISTASAETSKVIRTIDGIAFQTNLLALNAAVEAARAGDVGSGFAVVAQEVRNLALRVADAAKETAAMIEDTITKVNNGVSLATATNDAFGGVAANASQAKHLVADITRASHEQADGFNQLSGNMTNLSEVAQQLTEKADSYAASSERMQTLVGEMTGLVEELQGLTGGD